MGCCCLWCIVLIAVAGVASPAQNFLLQQMATSSMAFRPAWQGRMAVGADNNGDRARWQVGHSSAEAPVDGHTVVGSSRRLYAVMDDEEKHPGQEGQAAGCTSLQEGCALPFVEWVVLAPDAKKGQMFSKLSTDDVFPTGKRVVLFAVPGAFTPTCTDKHVPEFERLYADILKCGVHDVYCLTVNDAFVTNHWKKHLGIQNVKFIPDGSATFTKAVHMDVDKDNFGFGKRSWRYAAVITDKKVDKLFVEEGKSDNANFDPYDVSSADNVLHYLQQYASELTTAS